jgi:anhydro-N-acetylmuramic acid kinase
VIVIGLMSGTSADGVDAAVVRLEGAPPSLTWEVLGNSHRSFEPELRTEIFACFHPETGSVDRLCRLNFVLGQVLGAAALTAAHQAGLSMTDIDLIGSHGQTLWHQPPVDGMGSTLQFGEPAVIAEMTGVPVVSNFRTRDMAAGGQGAPLVPLADWLLLSHPTKFRAAQNIGGIANVTFLPPASLEEPHDTHRLLAFDTGPGNMLIDEAARLATNDAWNYDRDGFLAAQGRVDESLLDEWLAEPFFRQPPPRTTGRELFGTQRAAEYFSRAVQRKLKPNDIIATLTALTARSIAYAYHTFLPTLPEEVIVSGGGAHNPILMEMLSDQLAPARVTTSEEYGLGMEAKEAIAFAVLAYETWHKRPGNIPSATGASHSVVLGNITY